MRLHVAGLWANPEFLKLWVAQTVSFIGSQVTTLALPLTAALTLHASPQQMGMLRALDVAPALLAGVFAGALLDRASRRPVLIVADVGRALLLIAVPLAAVFQVLRIEHLYALALLAGIFTMLFEIAHMSLLPALVPKDRLLDGNSKLEVSRSIAMLAGPGIAGMLVQMLTAPIALLIDAVSFLVSALFLIWLRTPEPALAKSSARTSIWLDIAEGLNAVWKQPLLRAMALSLCVFNLFYSMVGTIYVLYAIHNLDLSPTRLGLIYAIGSAGFPVGAMLAPRIARRFGVGPAIVWGAGLSDAAFLLIPLAVGPSPVAMLVLIMAQLLATLAGPITAINQLSLRQALTPPHLQGRVNGMIRVIALGAAPVGALIAGSVGGSLGLRPTLIIGAAGLQLGFLVLFFSPVRLFREQPEAQIPMGTG